MAIVILGKLGLVFHLSAHTLGPVNHVLHTCTCIARCMYSLYCDTSHCRPMRLGEEEAERAGVGPGRDG